MTKTRNVPKKERILEVARKKERRACKDVLQTLWTSIPSKTLNQNRWRNKNIPW